MTTIATISLEYDGGLVHARAKIPPQAHTLGLTAKEWHTAADMGDDLGSPEGAGAIEAVLQHAAAHLCTSLRIQWNDTTGPLF